MLPPVITPDAIRDPQRLLPPRFAGKKETPPAQAGAEALGRTMIIDPAKTVQEAKDLLKGLRPVRARARALGVKVRKGSNELLRNVRAIATGELHSGVDATDLFKRTEALERRLRHRVTIKRVEAIAADPEHTDLAPRAEKIAAALGKFKRPNKKLRHAAQDLLLASRLQRVVPALNGEATLANDLATQLAKGTFTEAVPRDVVRANALLLARKPLLENRLTALVAEGATGQVKQSAEKYLGVLRATHELAGLPKAEKDAARVIILNRATQVYGTEPKRFPLFVRRAISKNLLTDAEKAENPNPPEKLGTYRRMSAWLKRQLAKKEAQAAAKVAAESLRETPATGHSSPTIQLPKSGLSLAEDAPFTDAAASVPLLAPSPAGRVVDKYLVGEVLGKGGMGVVHRATHMTLDQPRAYKELLAHLLDAPGMREGFTREMKLAASVYDPHVVTVFDSGDVDGTPYVIMELVEGTDLQKKLKKEGPLSVDEALRITKEAASGLKAVHRKGIVHRDIKPANLLLTSDGVTKVTDLGLAKLTENVQRQGQELGHTASGLIKGTPDYMAPEQGAAGHVDSRTDVYGLGATLFALLEGRPPFLAANGNLYQTIVSHATAPRPALDARVKIPPAVSAEAIVPGLTALVHKMMAIKPEERYQTMAEVVAAIDVLEQQLKLAASGATVQFPRATTQLIRSGTGDIGALTAVGSALPETGEFVQPLVSPAGRDDLTTEFPSPIRRTPAAKPSFWTTGRMAVAGTGAFSLLAALGIGVAVNSGGKPNKPEVEPPPAVAKADQKTTPSVLPDKDKPNPFTPAVTPVTDGNEKPVKPADTAIAKIDPPKTTAPVTPTNGQKGSDSTATATPAVSITPYPKIDLADPLFHTDGDPANNVAYKILRPPSTLGEELTAIYFANENRYNGCSVFSDSVGQQRKQLLTASYERFFPNITHGSLYCPEAKGQKGTGGYVTGPTKKDANGGVTRLFRATVLGELMNDNKFTSTATPFVLTRYEPNKDSSKLLCLFPYFNGAGAFVDLKTSELSGLSSDGREIPRQTITLKPATVEERARFEELKKQLFSNADGSGVLDFTRDPEYQRGLDMADGKIPLPQTSAQAPEKK